MKKLALGIAAIALMTGIAYICFWWKDKSDSAKRDALYEQTRQAVGEDIFAAEEEKALLSIPVDFAALQQRNPDIYAWLTIPGTGVDDPVLQNDADDAMYLTTSAFGEKSDQGAVFSEHANARDFSDVHTVLYGRNMADGSMFGELHKFEDGDFFQSHKVISVYTPDAARYYRVFAAYRYDDRHLLQSFDCSQENVFRAYIKEILGQRSLYANLDKEVQINPGDRILTLSTGDSAGGEYRYLVQAVLVKEQKRD